VCKLYLGYCPRIDFGYRPETDVELLSGFDLVQTIEQGFDLIMKGVLKEESGDE